ncbi:MAG: LacI family DNA-binding transcriptional regulator [Microbacterium sp.]
MAKLAGVSHQTVSRFLRFNGDGLKPATRERVTAAIEELNYRPNLLARSMRTRVTGRVAVLMPALAYNPARMLAGATRTAHDAGYTVEVISPEGGAASRAERILELSDTRQVDGILSLAAADLADGDLPTDTVVVISSSLDDEMRSTGELTDATPIVTFVEHLAELGHRRFYHVAGDADFPSARTRATAFTETIERLGLESTGIYEGDWSGESGVAAVRAIRAGHEPTAVIAANDVTATGVMRGAVERGWSIPGDISVTGWDNNPMGPFLSPSLTTVEVNHERVGSNGMARLIALLRNEEPQISDVPLNHIIWRESTGPAR